MPQQEGKSMKIVIPSFIQQGITTVLLDCTRREEINIFLKLVFTPCKTEQPLQGIELQEKETQKD